MAFLPRIGFVIPRFWPLSGGPETLVLGLGGELRRRGCSVTVLTPTWNPMWPRRLEVGGIAVERLRHVPTPGIDAVCYIRALGNHLSKRRDEFDLLCVSGLGYEAIAALRGAAKGVPVILRAERAGPRGDCQWQQRHRFAGHLRRRCAKAAAIITPWQSISRELQSAGYPPARLRPLANGVAIPPPRTPQRRRLARTILASTHAALDLPEAASLAVHIGQMESGRGLGRLIVAWGKVHAAHPRARLWLVGEGHNAKHIQRAIDEENLTGRVMMIGSFDAIDEILAAADLAIFPLSVAGTHTAVLEAMAAGLPVVAGDSPDIRELLADRRDGLLCDFQSPDAVAAAVEQILSQPQYATALGEAARARVETHFSLARMADEHLKLFAEVSKGLRQQLPP